jgi:hypothetical protein
MFKKITAIILSILLILSFAGCSRPVNGPTPASNATEATKGTESADTTEATGKTKATAAPDDSKATKATQAATKTTKATTATKATATKATTNSLTESTSATIETDEKLFTVDITLPASLFDGDDTTKFNDEAYAKEQGFISSKLNKDGSVTITMSKTKHKELLKDLANSLEKSFAEFVNSEDTPYIKKISHNADFTAVTIEVDKAAYENAFDLTPLSIAISVAMYQAFIETEYHVDITIADVTTGSTIDFITYPDESID